MKKKYYYCNNTEKNMYLCGVIFGIVYTSCVRILLFRFVPWSFCTIFQLDILVTIMKKTFWVKGLLSFVLIFVSGNAFADITGTEGVDYTVDTTTGAITILTTGQTVSGEITSDIIIKNTQSNDKMEVTFDNIRTGNGAGSGNSSVIISNTGSAYYGNLPEITINFIGRNVVVNKDKPGFIINPTSLNTSDYTQKPCRVSFDTKGESVFLIGSNSKYYKALADEATSESYIIFNKYAKFDKLYYSTSYDVTDEPEWVGPKNIVGTEKEFNSFIALCKSTYHFVKFTMNKSVETRDVGGGWASICFPYSGTVTGGKVYNVFGRVMWKEGDKGRTEREPVGSLRHLILKLNDNETAFEGGVAYFVKRDDDKKEVTFRINDNKYKEPNNSNKGLIGTYTYKVMESKSYFMNGGQLLTVYPANTHYVRYYCAYFPHLSETDNFLTHVTQYYWEPGKDYLVYSRSSGTGGDAADGNGNNEVKVSLAGLTILGWEETSAIMNIINENTVVPSQYYDLQGRKVMTPRKGSMYISNGKKILY